MDCKFQISNELKILPSKYPAKPLHYKFRTIRDICSWRDALLEENFEEVMDAKNEEYKNKRINECQKGF